MSKNNKENKSKLVGTVSLIVMSVVCAVIGLGMLFVPNMNEKVMCYIICGGLVVAGVVQFSKFFATAAYQKLHDYSFSSGALLVILGCCGLARASEISGHIDTYFGLLVLIMGVIMLQNAVSLKATKGKTWVVQLVFALLGLLSAVLVLADVKLVLNRIPSFTYWALLILGILNAISFLTVTVRVTHFQKQKAAEELVIDAAKQIDVEEVLPIEAVVDAVVKDAPEEIPAATSQEDLVKTEEISTEKTE